MNLLYIDLFCGAGGTSTGVNSARLDGEKCAKVIACVNHDANAIASHASNHPGALHFTEDIRTLELSPLIEHVQKCRVENPGAFTVLWASLECTNFSKAKGGKPRDADSRTLAEHLFRYIEAIAPDYIQIENVEEFMSWGAIDENGKPVSKDRGSSYIRWVDKVKKYGYEFEHRILNAADFGAYTSRKRFFGIFAKYGFPIIFPEQTHSKTGIYGLFGTIPRWKSVREVLDFEDEGRSIFTREKPLSEKTLERIYAGLIKFVAGGKDAFMVKYNSMNQRGKYVPPSLEEPCPTIATQSRLALASVAFLSKQFGGTPEDKNISIDSPAGTITTIDHHAFVSVHYGNGFNTSCESPAATLTTKDRMSLVQTTFLDMQYGNGIPSSVDTSAGTVTTNPKHRLVTVKPCPSDTVFPRVTIANRKHHYLMNPQFASAGSSVDTPCFTLIARMDKMPPYLVTTQNGGIAIEIYETDSPMIVKIKEFMSIYNIIDVKMRMLNITELKRIMGFPEDYVLIGTQADQKKFIGNAVEVNMARVLCEALCRALTENNVRSKIIA
jgi:Site-specific DNA methylase